MNAVWLTLLLALPAAAERAARPDPLASLQALLDAKRYDEVTLSLKGPALQKLSSRDLRRAYDVLGQGFEGLNQFDRALEVYQVGAAIFPKDINILTRLANLLHREGLDESAKPYFERILSIHANNASAHLGLAEAQAQLGFLDRAIGHYEAVLKEWKVQPWIWRDFAETLARKREYARAVTAIQEALRLEPDNIDSLLDLAVFRHDEGRRTEALATLARAAEAAPKRRDLRLQEALWRLEAGELDRSHEIAERVLKEAPDEPLALWVRASVSLRQGRLPQAAQDLGRAAAAKDSPFIAKTASAMLRALQPRP